MVKAIGRTRQNNTPQLTLPNQQVEVSINSCFTNSGMLLHNSGINLFSCRVEQCSDSLQHQITLDGISAFYNNHSLLVIIIDKFILLTFHYIVKGFIKIF